MGDSLAPFFICWPGAKFHNYLSLSTVLEKFENFVSVWLPVCRWSMLWKDLQNDCWDCRQFRSISVKVVMH